LMILFFYIKTFIFARNSRNKVSPEVKTNLQEINYSIRIAKGLFGSFFLFAICW
jgi:hypothetical protein